MIMIKKMMVRMIMRGNLPLRKRIRKMGLIIMMGLNLEMRVRVRIEIHQLRFYHHKHLTPLSIKPTSMSIIKWWWFPRMQYLYDEDIIINLSNGKAQRGIYLERKLTMIEMAKMPTFVDRFRQCTFQWMARDPVQYSLSLVHEFYVV